MCELTSGVGVDAAKLTVTHSGKSKIIVNHGARKAYDARTNSGKWY